MCMIKYMLCIENDTNSTQANKEHMISFEQKLSN